MKYDTQYLKTLYDDSNSLDEFLDLVDESKIDDPYTRAIISTLRRSKRVLNLQFNPIVLSAPLEKSQETNQPPN